MLIKPFDNCVLPLLARWRIAWLLVFPITTQAIGPNNTLNDTGIMNYGDAASGDLTTEPADYPGQDASHGRDAQAAAGRLTKSGGGSAGFDFSALDVGGNPTTPTSGPNPHHCVRDNVTGLIWEVKTDDGGFRDKDWTYTWYNSDPATNGGYAGEVSRGTCLIIGRCDTEKYVADVNAAGLCGYSDWRMPTVQELESIMDYSRYDPAIDPGYFPNPPIWSDSYYWSSSTSTRSLNEAWTIYMHSGRTHISFKGSQNERGFSHSVRLVQGEP